jgi:hypothetical protein
MVLLNKLNYIKKNENEIVREFYDKFERLIQQNLASHHLSNKFLIFLYTKAFTGQMGFPIRDTTPRTIQEAYDMATKVEANISSSNVEQSFVPEVKIGESKDTPDFPKRIPFLWTFVEETPKGLEQDIDQQEVEEGDLDEGYQSHGEEQEFTHASSKDNEDLLEEREPEDIKHDDEVLMCAPPSHESIPNAFPPAQEEEDEVSHFHFQIFFDTLFYVSEGEEERKPLDELDPPYYEAEDVRECHEDEELMLTPPFDEVIQIFDAPAQEEVNTVSCFPFQDFDDALFCDLERNTMLDEPLDALIPSCYDDGNNIVDNIDEFIHVGKRKWDVIGYDGDPIYDIEDDFQKCPLQLSLSGY